jgi:hypothetical protein
MRVGVFVLVRMIVMVFVVVMMVVMRVLVMVLMGMVVAAAAGMIVAMLFAAGRLPDGYGTDDHHHQQGDARPQDEGVEFRVEEQLQDVPRIEHDGDRTKGAADADGAELFDVIGAAVFGVLMIVSHV